jgi:transcriptional regulator
MQAETLELLRGTLDLLILRALKVESTHGYGVLRWIERATGDELKIEEGSLYPALYRMVQKRWIKGVWGVSENNRRAKFYQLTPAGQREFEQQANGWLRLSQAVSRAVTAPREQR